MFEAFAAAYFADPSTESQRPGASSPLIDTNLQALLDQFGGRSFNNGIYRLQEPSGAAAWNDRIVAAFPNARGRISCFGMDWLGRLFASDSRRSHDGEPAVLMFEPGTAQVLEVPANVRSFHNIELISSADAALAEPFYQDWLATGGPSPRMHECIGYKRPVFMNGKDDLGNLERIDAAVYWSICARFIEKVRSLPPGVPVDRLKI